MQQHLFGDVNSVTSKSLTISKGVKQQLSANQQAFNRLSKRIEKLQTDIKKKQLQFDLALQLYGSDFCPVQVMVLESRHKLISLLWEIYKNNRLSKTDQRHLKAILQYHLQEYFSNTETEPDEVIQNIFSAIEGISYDAMMQKENDEDDAEMYAMFDRLNVDMQGVDLEDEEMMAKKFAEAKQKILELQEKEEEKERLKQQRKKKTAKQLEHEKMEKAVDELKQKNITTIYRQLAKLFHPDLEQDPVLKAEKEILMKQLTAAYEAKNLHALLTLELQWIHKENDHLERLSEEKLSVYLQILKEQISNLEQEKNTILSQPQYATLAIKFGFSIHHAPLEIIRKHVMEARDLANQFNNDITNFESPMALRHVKEMIKKWKKREEEYDDEEMIRLLFG